MTTPTNSSSGLGNRNAELPQEQWVENPETGAKVVKVGDMEFPKRKVWMHTFGCQMNYHDTERVLSHLENLNFEQTKDQQEADLILFNTCAIRDLSNQKFYSKLGDTKHIKKKNPDVKIGVGGCVAQTEGKELVKKYKHLDFSFGTDVIDTINELVYRSYAGEDPFAINTWDRSQNFSIETKITNGSPQAFVNIIKGCNKCCSYCIVPFTRGKEKSRLQKEVVEDVRRLVEYQGVQEVTLLGQNVNSYGKDNGESLAGLITELDQINGLELIRYTTSHPYDVTDELVQVHGEAKKLSRHLHLPVQSGSNTVLQRMLREYTVDHYMGLVEKLRKAKPDIVLSTDIIAGFVNETEEEHQATLDLLDRAQYDFIYSYAYSQRNKTRASRWEDSLTDDIRGARLREIQAYQAKIQEKIRKELVGQTFTVLVDGHGFMGGEKKWKGRTNCMRIVHFLPEHQEHDLQWHWVEVEVTAATAFSCQGKLKKVWGRRMPEQASRY
ncbi:MAG: tRNA (N6-isopentenyl adenosine(37)-C2)-methylthiotransferase MiaB [Halobacteriovoraceae bacterium]|nr:tRNA (N6-isopentenyl adenosine(37)-C2)-methylthiotransferase MiaB [Halobacteriovoraceae bacterium]MBC96758.1 tRNA (N6-isopentenyl adenosine(37)-C2)-methylthiotransferase MiaB [Halobacteriovoraceae bacterium]|tara:strand:- start:49157 stop:50644 length:1488 start_codon:yes stop_codon:yes gene_type:complete